MSHYSYKKKVFLELPNDKILPLCLYSDSSLTSNKYDRYGRKHIYNPKHWCINTMGVEGIVIDKKEFNKAVLESYEREMNCLREFKDKYNPNEPEPNKDSYSYYGTVYPSGGKMKHMKSFYSTKHLVDVEDFLNRNTFNITISTYNPKDYKTIEKETIYIATIDDILKANDIYFTLKNKDVNNGICIGVYGLEGSD